jgi:hypothetical protein
MRWSRVLAFIIEEFKEVILPTVFFAVGFNLVALAMQLVLDDYFVRFASFIVVTTAALVVGKAVPCWQTRCRSCAVSIGRP